MINYRLTKSLTITFLVCIVSIIKTFELKAQTTLSWGTQDASLSWTAWTPGSSTNGISYDSNVNGFGTAYTFNMGVLDASLAGITATLTSVDLNNPINSSTDRMYVLGNASHNVTGAVRLDWIFSAPVSVRTNSSRAFSPGESVTTGSVDYIEALATSNGTVDPLIPGPTQGGYKNLATSGSNASDGDDLSPFLMETYNVTSLSVYYENDVISTTNNISFSFADLTIEAICGDGIDNDGDGDIDCDDSDCTSDPSCVVTCNTGFFTQAIKNIGALSLCDILLSDNSHPLATLDCDGGGTDNLSECQSGANPEDPSDDVIDLCNLSENRIDDIIFCGGFHSYVMGLPDGRWYITGENTQPNGNGHHLILTEVNASNGYVLPTGVTIQTIVITRQQQMILGSDGIFYNWGDEGALIHSSFTSSEAFGPSTFTLPIGVSVSDVSVLKSQDETQFYNRSRGLYLLTNSGDLYVIGDTAEDYYGQSDNKVWYQFMMPTGTFVQDFDIGDDALMILGSDNNFYTTGEEVFLGDGTVSQNNNNLSPLLMTMPSCSITDFGIISDQRSGNQDNTTYYVSCANGQMYSLGENKEGAELGINDSSPNETLIWLNVKDCNDNILTDVSYFSVSTATSAVQIMHLDNSISTFGATTAGLGGITPFGDPSICSAKVCNDDSSQVLASLVVSLGHVYPYISLDGSKLCNTGHYDNGSYGTGPESVEALPCYTCISFSDFLPECQ